MYLQLPQMSNARVLLTLADKPNEQNAHPTALENCPIRNGEPQAS